MAEISTENRLEQSYRAVKEQQQGNHIYREGFIDSAGKGLKVRKSSRTQLS